MAIQKKKLKILNQYFTKTEIKEREKSARETVLKYKGTANPQTGKKEFDE